MQFQPKEMQSIPMQPENIRAVISSLISYSTQIRCVKELVTSLGEARSYREPAPDLFLTLIYELGTKHHILFGLMILFPKYRYYGSIGLILLLIAVFPANIYLAQSKEAQEAIGTSQQIAIWRLPIQGILIWIAYWIRK